MDWKETATVQGNRQQLIDQSKLRAILLTTSHGDPKRAAHVISNSLNTKTNTTVREAFSEIIPVKHAKTGKTKDLIIDGIRESISLHTKVRDSRIITEETFVNNVVTAAVSKLVKEKKVVTST